VGGFCGFRVGVGLNFFLKYFQKDTSYSLALYTCCRMYRLATMHRHKQTDGQTDAHSICQRPFILRAVYDRLKTNDTILDWKKLRVLLEQCTIRLRSKVIQFKNCMQKKLFMHSKYL